MLTNYRHSISQHNWCQRLPIYIDPPQWTRHSNYSSIVITGGRKCNGYIQASKTEGRNAAKQRVETGVGGRCIVTGYLVTKVVTLHEFACPQISVISKPANCVHCVAVLAENTQIIFVSLSRSSCNRTQIRKMSLNASHFKDWRVDFLLESKWKGVQFSAETGPSPKSCNVGCSLCLICNFTLDVRHW